MIEIPDLKVSQTVWHVEHGELRVVSIRETNFGEFGMYSIRLDKSPYFKIGDVANATAPSFVITDNNLNKIFATEKELQDYIDSKKMKIGYILFGNEIVRVTYNPSELGFSITCHIQNSYVITRARPQIFDTHWDLLRYLEKKFLDNEIKQCYP
jgi:hypothetical protein